MLEVVVISEGQRREILLLVFGAYLQSNETWNTTHEFNKVIKTAYF